ncbi:ATP-binding protein involved in chromosome partitioning [Caldalkalibacillus uzonensis]|uniref:Iron-sulfur cluster carrier protein n=1 Tax=Caldalkalibacillus uzonensis TaxID=353224 RepID=A0ABU0CUX5_9BACI|nr:P-loop NTPase [Caldalkalibacillus uzonensis]MDQ0340223.1 ATP-binding protein involved in chromosome partitioning [Caldalkalibacillus uzonensis]
MLTEQNILDALKEVKDPELNKSLVELNMIRNIQVDQDNNVSLTVVLTISGCPLKATIEQDVVNKLKEIGANQVELTFGSMTDQERAALAQRLRAEAGGGQSGQGGQVQGHTAISPLLASDSKTQFIAVTSGKGGVGKSTVTVNLATALARMGKRVGVIDADIYGFSVPDMMGIKQRPTVIDEVILPVEKHRVKVMSMGFFVEDNSPVIWRGPMLGKMLRNFFSEVHWGELDYMILDLPPGTGDVALDVHTMIPQSKEIIVTTPHATAAFVAARAGAMALKTNHEILGVVENMAYYQLPDGSKDYIFGRGGGEKLANELKTELLAQVPLGQPDREASVDNPSPSIYPAESLIGRIYTQMAENIVQRLEVKTG